MSLTNLANKLESQETSETPTAGNAAELLSKKSAELGVDLANAPTCEYKGSEANTILVRQKILEMYGAQEAEDYEPAVNVCPRTEWLKRGFIVPRDEKALCTVPTMRRGRPVWVRLYHQNQVKSA